MVQIQDILASVGEGASKLTGEALKYLQDSGLIISPVTSKILTVLIILCITWVVLHFFQSIKPLVKWLIIIASVGLIISVFISLTSQ